MPEQITWTHVDKLVRDMHDEKGMLPIGLTDAEVAHAFIKWLYGRFNSVENERNICRGNLEITRHQLVEAQATKPSKTKQRLAILEEQVGQLMQWADRE